MTTREQSPIRDARSRAHGFVSAVLLVVLLATSGLPVDAPVRVEGGSVAAEHVGHVPAALRAVEHGDACGAAVAPAAVARAPRTPHRQRRIECGGLPPPRAPTR